MLKKENSFSGMNIALISIILALIFCYIFFALMIGLKDNRLSTFFKGTDFKVLYHGAQQIRNNNADDLYNINFYKDFLAKNNQAQIFKPVYPPILYYLYVPFTYLSYSWSIFLTTVLYIFLYILSVVFLVLTFKRLYKYSLLIILFGLIFPPFFFVLLNGHPSVLWIFILSLSFYLAKKDKPFFAGLVLSFFILKPNLFILMIIVLFFSFRYKVFSGLFIGSIFLFFISGIFNNFIFWQKWFNIVNYLLADILHKDTLILFGESTKRTFFYPMFSKPGIFSIIEYVFIIVGLFAIIFPIIYSYNSKKTFSRNSYWFIFPISIVLASPYLYNFDLIILILPIVIFFNLMLADRVLKKYIFIMICAVIIGILLCFIISIYIHIQLFAVVLWFFLINGSMGKRIRNFTPKNFIEYWNYY
jgi:Glycosyltransferase family 87